MEKVNHPSHYQGNKYECIDVMQDVFGKEAVSDFCKLNAFKYLWRSDQKNGLEDIEKCLWYLNKFIELEKGENMPPLESNEDYELHFGVIIDGELYEVEFLHAIPEESEESEKIDLEEPEDEGEQIDDNFEDSDDYLQYLFDNYARAVRNLYGEESMDSQRLLKDILVRLEGLEDDEKD